MQASLVAPERDNVAEFDVVIDQSRFLCAFMHLYVTSDVVFLF